MNTARGGGPSGKKSRRWWIYTIVTLLVLAFGIGIGLLIAYFTNMGYTVSNGSHEMAPKVYKEEVDVATEVDEGQGENQQLKDKHNIIERILDRVDINQIREHVRFFAEEPHPAGSARDEALAHHIKDLWKTYGLDEVKIHRYHVLTPSPSDKGNLAAIVDTNGAILFRSSWPTIRQADKTNKYALPWHAFSPSATVQGDLVYANYGMEEDYATLRELNVTVEGNIVIIKNGLMPTGDMVQLAESKGAIGVITYSDPANCALNGTSQKDVYPQTWWLAADGIVRAVVNTKVGDLLTPNYPSHKDVFRLSDHEVGLPRIPSQPISYRDAQELLGRLGGSESPEQWRGTLQVSYNAGPGFLPAFKQLKVRLSVQNERSIQPVSNVIGIIKGLHEPDRQVFLGNHRDAWVYGASDPVSGTATMMEIARIFGQLLKEGWRPRRTLVFCSWGAEEFGLVGSTEWVEDHVQELEDSAVAYINVDTCIAGDTFTPMLSPILKKLLIQVTQKVPDPDNPESSLYDMWLQKMSAQHMLDDNGQIQTQSLGVYSDFAPFVFYAGVPSIDLSWQTQYDGDSPFPSYHTEYDLPEYLWKFLDPKFERHRACARVAATMLHHLSESLILPYAFGEVVSKLKQKFSFFTDNFTGAFPFSQNNVSIGLMEEAIEDLWKAASEWQLFLDKERKFRQTIQRNISRGLFNRMTNDRMMLMAKTFFNRLNNSNSKAWFFRYGYEHSISAISDLLYQPNFKNPSNQDWKTIQQHFSNLLIMTKKAAQLLRNYKRIFL